MPLITRCFYILLFSASCLWGNARATEITIFDKQGEAVAYLDTDEENTIFLWSGRPVAYVTGKSIYGFNGKHLGWLDQGIFYDHDGYGVGFFENATSTRTQLESLKGLKQLKPLRSLKASEPLRPLFSIYWANTPLELFFLEGMN